MRENSSDINITAKILGEISVIFNVKLLPAYYTRICFHV